MKRLALIILMLYLHVKATAQHLSWPKSNDSGIMQQGRFHNPHPVLIFVEPSAVLSPFHNNAIRAGAEFPLMRSLNMYLAGSYFLEGGYGFKSGLKIYSDKNTWLSTKKGFLRAVDRRPFVAVEYAYKSQSYNPSDSIKYPPYGTRVYHVDKTVHIFSLQVGEIKTFPSGLYTEWFAGAGFRIKTATNDLKPGETDSFYHWHEGQSEGPSNGAAFKELGPHFALGFKVGWRFQ